MKGETKLILMISMFFLGQGMGAGYVGYSRGLC